MERARIIEHRGTPILLSDLSGLHDTEELQRAVRIGGELLQSQAPRPVLVLVDVTGLEYSVEAFAILQQSVATNRPYVSARAVVGLPAMASVPFEIVARISDSPMAKFADREAAMDWLVSHG
jgi:hypothetical protein